MSLIPMKDLPDSIQVSDLRRWGTMFFDLLEARGHQTIPLKHSYYWSVTPPEQIYNAHVKPDFDGLDDLYDNLRDVMGQEARPEEERVINVLEDYTALLAYVGTGLPFQSAAEPEETH